MSRAPRRFSESIVNRLHHRTISFPVGKAQRQLSGKELGQRSQLEINIISFELSGTGLSSATFVARDSGVKRPSRQRTASTGFVDLQRERTLASEAQVGNERLGKNLGKIGESRWFGVIMRRGRRKPWSNPLCWIYQHETEARRRAFFQPPLPFVLIDESRRQTSEGGNKAKSFIRVHLWLSARCRGHPPEHIILPSSHST